MSRRSPDRNIESGMANMNIDTSKSSRMMGMFDRKATSKASSSKAPPATVDDDGYTLVKPRKSSVVEQKHLQVSTGNGRRTVLFTDNSKQPKRSPPSAAAQSRTNTYAVPKAHYKSDLPAEAKLCGKPIHRDQYRPGMIIRAYVHEQDYEAASSKSNVTVKSDKHRSITNYGPIFTKRRPMIVLAKREDHYIAIPIFTHNGNGIHHKKRPDEYVSIKDHRSNDDSPPQSKYPHLETQTMAPESEHLRSKSTVHITYALSRRYDLPVTIMGQLTDQSLHQLIEYFNRFVPRPKH
ncbi:MAG: hypothetical protein L6R36_006266 [Xanthoria steineri]|nr:MAG: hypothetical protein L6R36_006266 [Xanthoria steineri]